MKMKKLKRYRERFSNYVQKASASENPDQKISFYNKILKIIKKLQFLETKGKVNVSPSLIKLEKFFRKGRVMLLKKQTVQNKNGILTRVFQ